jgi:AcrR family transcriptional regulator
VVLDAAESLVRESGYAGLTITAVAQRAGTSKPAVYRRWRTRQHLAIGVLSRLYGAPAEADTGNVAEDVRRPLRQLVELLTGSVAGELLPILLMEVKSSPELSADLERQVVLPRRNAHREALQRAIQRGEIVPPEDRGLDLELILDLLVAPIVFRLLGRHQPVDYSLVESSIQVVLALLAPPPSTTQRQQRA